MSDLSALIYLVEEINLRMDKYRDMKIDRLFLLGLLSTGIALTSLELITAQAAQAKPIFLADLPCPQRTKGSSWNEGKEDVVLSREIYTSLMYISYGNGDSEFACKLPDAKSAELDIEAGLPSTANGYSILKFYLNGTEVASEKIFPGKVTTINQKLTGRLDVPYQIGPRRTLVVETICVSGSGCSRIQFFKANLNVVGNPNPK
jgi:hypothetical protein